MGQTTGIKWTDATGNFWWGCQRVSPGCENCYAEQLATVRRKLPVWGPPKTTRRDRKKDVWTDIVKWNAAAAREGRRLKVFVSSMADVFEDHPQVAPWRDEALALLAGLTSLDVQLLTKRPENITRMVPPAWLAPGGWPAHVWVGTTVEDQKRADERIPHLLAVPARVRFLSCEPMIEAVNLEAAFCVYDRHGAPSGPRCNAAGSPANPWVIIGGESGSDARPFAAEWARDILTQCDEAGVAAFMKQFGDNPTTTLPNDETWPTHSPDGSGVQFVNGDGFGRYCVRGLGHHGADPSKWPVQYRVQRFPK